jgi:molybdopterin-guanine dinucleotide biosynthesis protein A
MTKRAVLILAGGKASRFQHTNQSQWEDKALAEVFGKPMLIHEVENALSIANQVIICVNDDARKEKYLAVLDKFGLATKAQFAVDQACFIGGPNVGILSGLKAASADWCMTLPCDIPLMKPQVMEALLEAALGVDVAVPIWPDGRLETLVMVLHRRSGMEVAEALCSLGRERSDDFFRGAGAVKFVSPIASLKTVDPKLESFVNINSQDDLTKLPPRNTTGEIKEDFRVFLRPPIPAQLNQLQEAAQLCRQNKPIQASTAFAATAEALEEQEAFFWAAIARERQGAFLTAANNYGQEIERLLDENCSFLADRAMGDKAWCESLSVKK